MSRLTIAALNQCPECGVQYDPIANVYRAGHGEVYILAGPAEMQPVCAFCGGAALRLIACPDCNGKGTESPYGHTCPCCHGDREVFIPCMACKEKP